MQRIRKERRPTNRKSQVFLLSFSHDVFFSIPYEKCSVYYHVFNFSIPLLFCVFSYLWKEIFHERLWKSCGNFPYVFLPHTKLTFPCMQGNFSYVIFLFHTKLIFPCMQGDLNKSNARNIFVGCK